MGIISTISNMICSWFTSRTELSKEEYKIRCREQEYKKHIEECWSRLFSNSDYNSIEFLKNYANYNDWKIIDDDTFDFLIDHHFCDDTYEQVEMPYNNTKCKLFQTKTDSTDQGNKEYIRITPQIYKEFRRRIKKQIKKGFL